MLCMHLQQQSISQIRTGLAARHFKARRQAYSQHKGRSMVLAAERRFDLVTTDVDGTLLSSKNELTPRTQQAIEKCIELGVPVCIATGKAKGPWVKKVLPKLGKPMPGVYIQGLLIYNADGTLMHEESLSKDLCDKIIQLAKDCDITLTAYSYERILAESTNADTDRLLPYEDPVPEGVGDLAPLVEELNIQKFIMINTQEKVQQIRQRVADTLGDGTHVALTQAIPGMLEVGRLHGILKILPAGASKGRGVKQLLEHLNVKPERVLALGDGENDVQMLKMVGVGVAMGNCSQVCLDAADDQVASNDNDGVAEALEKYILAPAGITLQQTHD